MADQNTIPGSPLGDLFAGTAGANINRPQLNAFVANAQARNGLYSAQTQDALIKAQQQQESVDAYNNIPNELASAFPGMRPSEAQLARDLIVRETNGDPITALKAIGTMKLGYGQPTEQTSGQQMVKGQEAGPVQTPPNFQMPPGSPLANVPVQQSPQGAAQTALTNQQATNPQLFHPGGQNAAGALDPAMVDFGGYMLYKTGKMPAMGMGGGPARAAIISHAAQLSQAEASGQPVANPGYDTAIQNGQDYTAAGRALGSFAGGSLSNSTRSLNNAVGHLQLMDNLFKALNNGDVQTVNKLSNTFTKQFGSPAPTNVQAAAEVLGPELMKILSNNNGAGTVDERQGFANTVGNLANSPEQTAGAISTLRGMLGRQAADLALQYHGATQRNDFSPRYLQPDVANYLELSPQTAQQQQAPASTVTPLGSQIPTPSQPATPTAASAKPVQIQNDDDYNKLPSGALFIGPDGHTRKKP
jgi:hypothetical protein